MKKLTTNILLLALAALMALGCTACGGKKVPLKILDTEYVTEDYAIAIAKENTALLEQINTAIDALIADGTVDQIIAYYIEGVGELPVVQADAEGKEEITMATNAAFPPYEYWEEEMIQGIDPVLAGAIADKLDKKLVIEDMEWNSLISAVATGKVDFVMAGMSVTEERKQSVSFSNTYATGIQVIIVPEGSPITTVDDLFAEGANHTIGAQINTTGDIYATGDIEDEGLGTVEKFNTGADAIAALVAGKLDCVIIDNEPAKVFVANNNK